MSVLHEYVCQGAGLQMGRYYQIANDLHLYTGPHKALMDSCAGVEILNPYATMGMGGMRLFGSPGDRAGFDADCNDFCAKPTRGIFRTDFFTHVISPMFKVWMARKDGDIPRAMRLCSDIKSSDWARACEEWMGRRFAAQLAQK
jgi:hypothetical protein